MLYRRTLTLITILITLLLFTTTLQAQWEEVPSKGLTVDFAGTFNQDANAFTGTGIYAGCSYWIGVNADQITANKEIVSQDLEARAQAGLDLHGISLQAFIEAERNQDSELTTGAGGYIRKVIEIDKLDLTLGVGSLVEREEIRAELNLDAADPTVLPYYLWSIGAEYDLTETVGIHARTIATPEYSFDNWKGTFELGTDIVLSDTWTLKIQSTNEFEKDKPLDTQNSVILSLNL